jgi:Flp pilus assembly protein TadB
LYQEHVGLSKIIKLGLQMKTGIGEARRSARAKNHCIFARDFNTESVAVLRQRRKKRKRRAETEATTNHEESATAANQAGNEVAPKRLRVDSKPRRPEGKQ